MEQARLRQSPTASRAFNRNAVSAKMVAGGTAACYPGSIRVPSFAAHQLRPALLLRGPQALSFLLQFGNARSGGVHGLRCGIVAVHGELKREDELSVDHLV